MAKKKEKIEQKTRRWINMDNLKWYTDYVEFIEEEMPNYAD